MKASCKNEIACYQHYGNGSQNIREENVYINNISVSISSENRQYCVKINLHLMPMYYNKLYLISRNIKQNKCECIFYNDLFIL